MGSKVTGRYLNLHLHETSSAKPLLEYIRQKNQSQGTLQSISWEDHGTAINRTFVPHTHVVNKLLHRLLVPTHAQANKLIAVTEDANYDADHQERITTTTL